MDMLKHEYEIDDLLSNLFGRKLDAIMIQPSWPSMFSSDGNTPMELRRELKIVARALRTYQQLSRINADDVFKLMWPSNWLTVPGFKTRKEQMTAFAESIIILSNTQGLFMDEFHIKFDIETGEKPEDADKDDEPPVIRTKFTILEMKDPEEAKPVAEIRLNALGGLHDWPNIEIIFFKPTRARKLVSHLQLGSPFLSVYAKAAKTE